MFKLQPHICFLRRVLPLALYAILAFGPAFAFAEVRVVERVVEAQTSEKNSLAAKRTLVELATQSASEGLIKEIIGDAKFARSKTLIYSKIIKNAAKYIPYSKSGELSGSADAGYKMTTSFKVNLDDLQAMLLEQGLFYESDGPPAVVPMVRFQDKVNGRKYAWWSEDLASERAFLVKQNNLFEDILKTAFAKNYFYLTRATRFNWGSFLTSDLRAFQLKVEDLQILGQAATAQMVIDGEVSLQKQKDRGTAYQIVVKLVALQVLNGRMLGEVTRSFDTGNGPFESMIERKSKEAFEVAAQDLSAQVLDAWQKGSLGSSLYKLTVRGGLGLLQQEQLKEFVRSKLREVKTIRERLISSESITYEVDTTLNPQDLSRKLPEIELQELKLVLESASESETIYRHSTRAQ